MLVLYTCMYVYFSLLSPPQEFPPLPPLERELEKLLLSPEILPIHDVRAAQK